MRSILFIVFSFFAPGLFAQQYELTKDSDTLYYYKYEKPIIEKLRLIQPKEKKDFFRFGSDKYYLELSSESNKYLMYVEETWEGKKTGKTFIKEFSLTEKQVNEIKNLIASLKIHEIPTDNQIKNWAFGLDGITYTFELKAGNNYSHKHYWTPTSQQKFVESNIINYFIIKVDEIIDYQQNRKKFTEEIPYFSWTKDGVSWNAVKLINKDNYSEYKRYKKLMRKNKS
ncbi:hypothetical protein [Chryseobacterium phocaeense]|uniref:hypothetical protein n=1 Tax=Chryseobacterium phocaeense TaxID=1816690 RepID=UPI0009BB2702|nr:hypothetical protein [Chryseobacterium phocaeense]